MNKLSLIEVLTNLGLSENESKVYGVLLKLKKALPSRVAEEAHLSRGTTYHILEYLHKKDLIFKLNENSKLAFAVKKPDESLRGFLGQQQQALEQRKNQFEHSLDVIQSQFLSGSGKIAIRYYEGEKGFWEFFLETLEVKHLPMIGYAANAPLHYGPALQKFPKEYAKIRFQKRALGRYLTLGAFRENVAEYLRTYYGKYLAKLPELVRTKVLPETKHTLPLHETVIFDDKYAMSDGYDPKKFLGVIIEDANIANTQRTIFDSLWKMVKEEIKIL